MYVDGTVAFAYSPHCAGSQEGPISPYSPSPHRVVGLPKKTSISVIHVASRGRRRCRHCSKIGEHAASMSVAGAETESPRLYHIAQIYFGTRTDSGWLEESAGGGVGAVDNAGKVRTAAHGC